MDIPITIMDFCFHTHFLKPTTKIPRFKKDGTTPLTIKTYTDFGTLSNKTHH